MRIRIHLLGAADIGGNDRSRSIAERCTDLRGTPPRSMDELAGLLAELPTEVRTDLQKETLAHQPLVPLANAYAAHPTDEPHGLLLIATAQDPSNPSDTAGILELFQDVLAPKGGVDPSQAATFGIENLESVIGVITTYGIGEVATTVRTALSELHDSGAVIDGVDVIVASGATELFLGIVLGAISIAPLHLIIANAHDRTTESLEVDLTGHTSAVADEMIRRWLGDAAAFDLLSELETDPERREEFEYFSMVASRDWDGAREIARRKSWTDRVVPNRRPNNETEHSRYRAILDEMISRGVDWVPTGDSPRSLRHLMLVQNWIDITCQSLAYQLVDESNTILDALKDAARDGGVPEDVVTTWTKPVEAEWCYLLGNSGGHREALQLIFNDDQNNEPLRRFLLDDEPDPAEGIVAQLSGVDAAVEMTLEIRHGRTIGNAVRERAFRWLASKATGKDRPRPMGDRDLVVMPVGGGSENDLDRESQFASVLLRSVPGGRSTDFLLVATDVTKDSGSRIVEFLRDDPRSERVDLLASPSPYPAAGEVVEMVRGHMHTVAGPIPGRIVFACNQGTKELNLGILLALAESALDPRVNLALAPARRAAGSTVIAKDEARTVAHLLHDRVVARLVREAIRSADLDLALAALEHGSTAVFRSGEASIESRVVALQKALSHSDRPGNGYDDETVARLRFWRAQADRDPVLAVVQAVAILDRGGAEWRQLEALRHRPDLQALRNARNVATHEYWQAAPEPTAVRAWIRAAVAEVEDSRRAMDRPPVVGGRTPITDLVEVRNELLEELGRVLQP